MMMRGNPRSNSNCARRTSSSSSNFKASREKIAPPTKEEKLHAVIKDIHKLNNHKLKGMIEDREIPNSIKGKIKSEIESRKEEDDTGTDAANDDGDKEVPQAPPAIVSPYLLDQLYHKKGTEREKALAAVIRVLNQKLDRRDLNKKSAVTLLYRCLNGVKKGSVKEVEYSLQVIGKLSIILDCKDKTSEIYREFLGISSTKYCLKKAGPNTVKMLECLSVVTVFGANNAEETQAAMKVIWDFMSPEYASGNGDVSNRKKHSPDVLVGAIYSWLFLLTVIEGWRLHQTYWSGAISFFMGLLEKNDDSLVSGAATAALALIIETGSVDKFWRENNSTSYSQLENKLRMMILKTLKGLNPNQHVVRYFENLCLPEACVALCSKKIALSSWYELIQLEFLRSFLKEEFENYMEKEEQLQKFFEFNPHSSENVGEELYVSETESIMVNLFMPEGLDQSMLTSEAIKKDRVWRASLLDKAKTQLRAKHRLLSEQLNSFD